MEVNVIKLLSKTVLTYRAKIGLSRHALSQKSNGKLSTSTIRDIESGKNSSNKDISPTITTLVDLAETMEIPFEDLMMEIGLIPRFPKLFLTQINSLEFLKDIEYLLKRYDISIDFSVND